MSHWQVLCGNSLVNALGVCNGVQKQGIWHVTIVACCLEHQDRGVVQDRQGLAVLRAHALSPLQQRQHLVQKETQIKHSIMSGQ
jgi:hypothetical protein